MKKLLLAFVLLVLGAAIAIGVAHFGFDALAIGGGA